MAKVDRIAGLQIGGAIHASIADACSVAALEIDHLPRIFADAPYHRMTPRYRRLRNGDPSCGAVPPDRRGCTEAKHASPLVHERRVFTPLDLRAHLLLAEGRPPAYHGGA